MEEKSTENKTTEEPPGPAGSPRKTQYHALTPGRRGQGGGPGNIFKEVMAEDVPNSAKHTNLQIREAEEIPNGINTQKPTPKHIVTQLRRVSGKAKVLKLVTEKRCFS